MARFMLKGVLVLSLLAGVVVLFAGHQLYLLQKVARGELPGHRMLIPQLVPRFEAVLGTEVMLDPQTLNVAWVAGGILAGVGFLGRLVTGVQDTARARKAALLVPPPSFDDRDQVSSHHFVAEGLATRGRMQGFLMRLISIPVFLLAALTMCGLFATAAKGRWLDALVLLGVSVGCGAVGVLMRRADSLFLNRFLKRGVERIDVMTGGLRWVRHGDPTERTVAWSQIYECRPYDNAGHVWNHYTVVALRTGEEIWLPKCCLSDYDECVRLVERGLKEGALAAKRSGGTNLAAAFSWNR